MQRKRSPLLAPLLVFLSLRCAIMPKSMISRLTCGRLRAVGHSWGIACRVVGVYVSKGMLVISWALCWKEGTFLSREMQAIMRALGCAAGSYTSAIAAGNTLAKACGVAPSACRGALPSWGR